MCGLRLFFQISYIEILRFWTIAHKGMAQFFFLILMVQPLGQLCTLLAQEKTVRH